MKSQIFFWVGQNSSASHNIKEIFRRVAALKKSDVVNCYFIERGPFVTRLHFLFEIGIFFHLEFWMPKDRLSSLGERGNCSYLVTLTLRIRFFYLVTFRCSLCTVWRHLVYFMPVFWFN